MGKISDIYSELKLDLSSFYSSISKATSEASKLGSAMNNALGKSATGGIDEARRSLDDFSVSANKASKNIGNVVKGILISQTFYAAASAIKSAAAEVYNFQKSTDTAAISFKTLLGDAQAANAFLKQLEGFAAVTPFQLENIRDYARRLLSAGYSAKSVIPTMRTLGDAVATAGGSSETLDRIVDVMVKIKAQGRLTSREVNRIAQAGIEIYPILQKELGLTAEEMQNIGKAGIDADTAISAILKGWQEKFGGTSEQISKTMDGIISNIKDNFVIIMSEAFQGLFESFRGVAENVGNALNRIREVIQTAGVGGLLEQFVPPDLQDKLRVIVVEIMQLGGIIRDVGIIAAQGFRPLVDILFLLEPIIGAVAQVIHLIAQAAASGSVWVRVLVGAMSGLFIASKLIKILVNFRTVIAGLAIAKKVAGAVSALAGGFRLLSTAIFTNPIAAAVAVIASALLAIMVSSDKASQAMDGLMERLVKLFGVDVKDVMETKDAGESLNDLGKGLDKLNQDMDGSGIGKNLDDVGKGMDDVGKGGGKAGKGAKKAGDGIKKTGKDAKKANDQLKDFLFSFDEVYRIPEEMKKAGAGGAGGGPGGGGDGGGGAGGGGPLDGLFGDIGGAGDRARKGLHDMGESIRDQLAKMPPIMLPGFIWPPMPPVPEIAFEPVFQPVLEWIQVRIPQAMEDFVTWLQTVPAMVQTAWDPVGEALKVPIRDFVTDTIPQLQGWIGRTLEDLWTWSGEATSAVASFRDPSLGILRDWTPQALGALQGFRIPAVENLKGWATESLTALRGFTVPSKQELTTWATDTITTIKNWSAQVAPSLSVLGIVGLTLFTKFATDSKGVLNKWAPEASGVLSGFAITTKALIDGWQKDTVTAFKNWNTNTSTNFKNWNTGTNQTFNGWNVSTNQTFQNWSRDTRQKVGDWIRDTLERYRRWSGDVNTNTLTWARQQSVSFEGWKETIKGKVRTWASNVMTTFRTWSADSSQEVQNWNTAKQQPLFQSWNADAWGKIKDFAKKAKETLSPEGGMLPTIEGTKKTTESMREKFGTFVLLTLALLGKQFIPKSKEAVGGKSSVAGMTAAAGFFFAPLPALAKDKTGKAIKEIGGLTPGIRNQRSSIFSATQFMTGGFLDAWNSAVGRVKSLISGIGGVTANIPTGKGAGHITASFNQMANGGMIGRDQFIRIGEQNKRETVLPLENPRAMAPVYNYINEAVRSAVGTAEPTTTSAVPQRPLYVGTLIADDRGLRELHRQFQIYDVEEEERRGL